jgi:hypothetical protein
MKKTFTITSILVLLSLVVFSIETTAATKTTNESSNYSVSKEQPRKKRKKAKSGFIQGRRGGCFYRNRKGNKTYVSRSLCRK